MFTLRFFRSDLPEMIVKIIGQDEKGKQVLLENFWEVTSTLHIHPFCMKT